VQTEEAFELTLDIPGIQKERIEIDLVNGVLSVNVEPGKEAQPPKADEGSIKWHCTERSRNFKKRCVRLPEAADTSNIKAAYENGVLTVVVPKLEMPNKKKRVTVS
jgi:HSP20 family protein